MMLSLALDLAEPSQLLGSHLSLGLLFKQNTGQFSTLRDFSAGLASSERLASAGFASTLLINDRKFSDIFLSAGLTT